jgi:hypothetical protein
MSVKFKDLFPDYQAYSNDDFFMNKVTYNLLKELSFKLPKLLVERTRTSRGLNLDGTFRNMCDVVSGYTNNEKTTNWGFDYIIRDFENQMPDFQNVKFHKFMDCILELKKYILNPEKELNDIFEEYDFGYRLTEDPEKPWISINPSIGMAVKFDEVIQSTKDVCMQTSEHIKQTKEQLTRATEPRARKDAIRDCLSAMEALMKKITVTEDIKDADKKMRDDIEVWGPKEITGDGIKLWNLFHRLYPDTRHGDPEITEISYEQAIYFVERILAYVKYISTPAVDEKEVELIF